MGAIICKGEYYGGSDVIEITQADYDALSSEQKNNGTLYVIKDAPSIIDIIYPVGSIYMSVNNVNPGTYLKDTAWEAWGSGRVPVGVSTDTEFNTVEKTGGSKTHTHNVGIRLNGYYYSTNGLENASGINGMVQYDANNNISAPAAYTTSGNVSALTTNSGFLSGSKSVGSNVYQSVGNTSYSSDLQPYITCYMWKRTH